MASRAKSFTISLSGPDGHVAVTALIEALENVLAALRALEPEFTTAGTSLKWEIVRVSMRSPLKVTVAPKATNAATRKTGTKIVKAYMSGLRVLHSRNPMMPQHFNEEVLDASKRMVTKAHEEDTQLSIYAPDEEPVAPTTEIVENINRIVAKTKSLKEEGTIDGYLEAISTHNGDSFTIWETATNKRVECLISESQLEQAKSLLRERVAVSGLITYKNKQIRSVQVREIKTLRKREQLPQLANFGPIDLTGGLSSEEFVRRLRDAN